jgi:hypothetical protein
MKEDNDAHLTSIRNGVWVIVGVILLIFGYENTSIGKTEVGSTIAIIGLIAGILMITYVIGRILIRLLILIKKVADEENQLK